MKINFDDAKLNEWGRGSVTVASGSDGGFQFAMVQQGFGFAGPKMEKANASIN